MNTKIFILFSFFFLLISAMPIRDEANCFLCKIIVTNAEKTLTTTNDVENYLNNKACKLPLAKEFKNECTSFINKYAPSLVSKIVSKQTPTKACEELEICNNQVKQTVPLLKLNAVKPSSQKVDGALECTICTTVINLAESILGSNASETEIENFLQNTVCGILPGSLKTDCDALIQAYLPALIQYIQQGESGSVACAQLGLCNSTITAPLLKLNAVKPSSQKVGGALECTICTTVINLAESILGSNASETEIENFLQNTVCGILPGSLKTDCDALIQAYLPALIQYIQQGESGSVACAQLGLCNSTTTAPLLKLNAVKPSKTQVRGSIECTVCQIIVTLAEDFLASNATESQIENFLENTVCSLVPSSYTSVCDAFVQQYTPSLVVYIQNKESPSVACNSVGVCNSTVIIPPMKLKKF